ncbi:small ribosomal subunit Rsm22 family protein [Candidatus Rhabdochlamydia porcellionis]|jgi:ribosomal protein RSM22 (predicted rRNA methylase)|uniref:Mitochondrial small ribosomal subunit Rsm22 n=1 Tax=Candidatus Rhabdochlamydia porcellionis TaxID=225148 RepID=A0ABX8YXY4_9BACT|nr:small ribosomal subunit Rsm22 family protein [Candidatus Rhabdochlamydia porcellionis]QZA58141.1 Mitochondrial small ribosomal subunit Rsm22 [Candidatus Rhabdochlamydia porcellionis]
MLSSLESKIQSLIQGTSLKSWVKQTQSLTSTYRQKKDQTETLSSEALRIAYLCSRLPATYAAISYVFKELQKHFDLSLVRSLLDCGAGPASVLLAAESFFSLQQATLLERDPGFIELGKLLSHPTDVEVIWMLQDVTKRIPSSAKDLVIASYSLCEISEEDQLQIVESLWDKTEQIFILLEPGTPKGFHFIRKAREKLLNLGALLLAPCPHREGCPINKSDWCHFSVRLPRSFLHRQLKEGSLNYEDEKFSYLIFSRIPVSTSSSRVIRHPFKGSGFVKLKLCTEAGLVEKTISRKDKELYSIAKKTEWGDELK